MRVREVISLAVVSTMAVAHVEMFDPPPIKSKYNRYYDPDTIDYDYNNPLGPGEFPCKGYHVNEDKKPIYSYEAGETYYLSLSGTATHSGGSCQVSLSYDEGGTFKVIKSIIGGCPIPLDYQFTIPEYAPDGIALLSWSWISNVGNRDFYHNCAWVDVINRNTSYTTMTGPDMFVAQLPGTCTVPEGYDFVYPNPGQFVEYGGDPDLRTVICDDASAEVETEGNTDRDDDYDGDYDTDHGAETIQKRWWGERFLAHFTTSDMSKGSLDNEPVEMRPIIKLEPEVPRPVIKVLSDHSKA